MDFYILNAIQGMRTRFLDALMPAVTFLGSGGTIWILAAIFLICFKKSRKTGIAVMLSLLIGLLLSTLLLKGIVARERPFNLPEGLLSSGELLIGVPSGRYSFPSGHAVSSFAAAAVIFMYNKKIGIPAIILAALIAFSRLYLYVHFPTDVLAGAVLGICFAIFSVFTVNKIGDKTNERKLPDNS